MGKLRSKRERSLRRNIALAGRTTDRALEIESAITNLPKYLLHRAAKKAAKADEVQMVRGIMRNRTQFLNPETRRWSVVDTKTGKILRTKKSHSPFKRIRKN